LPFIVELDGRPVIHAKRNSRENSKDLNRLVADMKREFDQLKFNSRINISSSEQQSIDNKHESTNYATAIHSPIESIEIKKLAYNLRNCNSKREAIDFPLTNVRKNVLPSYRDNVVNKTFSKYFVSKAFQSSCKTTLNAELNAQDEIQREDIKRIFNEKKKMITSKRKICSQVLKVNLREKQVDKIEESITNVTKDELFNNVTAEIKQVLNSFVLKKINDLTSNTIKVIEERVVQSINNYDVSLKQIVKYHKQLHKKYKEELDRTRIMKCAIDRLRSEKEKLEVSYAKLGEDHKALRQELDKHKEALENAKSSINKEVHKKTHINFAYSDEYYAIEAELNKAKANYMKLEVKSAREHNYLINEKNKALKLNSELKKNLEALKTSHSKELEKFKRETEKQLSNKDQSLSSITAERDTILKELSVLRARFSNKKIDKQTMTTEESPSKKYKKSAK